MTIDISDQTELRARLNRAANSEDHRKQIRELLANISELVERAFADGQRVAIHGETGSYISGAGEPNEKDGRRPLLRDWDASLAFLVFIGPRPPKNESV